MPINGFHTLKSHSEAGAVLKELLCFSRTDWSLRPNTEQEMLLSRLTLGKDCVRVFLACLRKIYSQSQLLGKDCLSSRDVFI